MSRRTAEQALRGDLAAAYKALERAKAAESTAKDAVKAALERKGQRESESAIAVDRVRRLGAALDELVPAEAKAEP